MLLVLCMYVCLFGCTDWAWSHSGYVTLMTIPVISLVNSRQIVCNVTEMEMDTFPKITLWYVLFPINKYLLPLI